MNSILSLFSLNLLKNSGLITTDFSIETIISYLKIPPNLRQIREISILKILTSKISFFNEQSENTESIHYQSCQSMRYEHFERDSTVFNCGDWGKKFYIIISGTVEILIPDQSENLIQVAVLHPGKSFGEMALLKESPRNATVRCLSECHFAVLLKDDYLRILGKIADKKVTIFVDFFKDIPVFKAWSKKNIESLYHFFRLQTFNRKNLVYSVGQDADFVYVVNSGEFEISKSLILPDGKTKIDLKIAILTRGEMFGDEDVLDGKTREYKCTCYSANGELLAITAKDFLLKVKNDDSLVVLNSKNKAKSLIRYSKKAVFNNVFNEKLVTRTLDNVPKLKKQVTLKRKYIPHSNIKKDWSRYLELSPKELQKLKEKAIGKKSGRVFISMNLPKDYSQRSPSPVLKLQPLNLSLHETSRRELDHSYS